MVKLRRPAAQRAVVIKPARGARAKLKRTSGARCVVCGATLRGGHALGDLVCDCHPHDGYNPRHDPRLEERILVFLYRAGGVPLNLYRALGCDVTDSNRNALHEAVKRMNAIGLVRVRGHKRIGYELVTHRREGRGR